MNRPFKMIHDRTLQPSVLVFVHRQRGVFHARAGTFESVSASSLGAVRCAASAALDAPDKKIELRIFSPTCARATVKRPVSIDPVVVALVVFFALGAASLAALFWRHGGVI